MTSPRKFAEKIALMQQKAAEGDAAFSKIIFEVEAAKQHVERSSVPTGNNIMYQSYGVNNSNNIVSGNFDSLDIHSAKYDQQGLGFPSHLSMTKNGMTLIPSDNHSNQQQIENNGNLSERLLQPPDAPWRRTHSDSSLHHTATVLLPINNDMSVLYDSQCLNQYSQEQYHHLQQFNITNNCHIFDQNNDSQIYNDFTQTNNTTNTNHHVSHTNNPPVRCGNVLMIPTSQHPPHGGSLPDLSSFQNQSGTSHRQQQSYSSSPSSSSSVSQQFNQFQPKSPTHQNNSSAPDDLFSFGPQQQHTSNVGPVRGPSPSIRRRHSPIGDGKNTSPRRQNSPSPDVCPNQQTVYRVESSSPQSQSSYSPQGSPHLLASPANDISPFSPQDNNQQYFTLPNQFDQISLEGPFVFAQQPSNSSHNQLNSSNGVSYTNSHQSATSTSSAAHNLNCLRPRTFFPTFIDDLRPYCQSQTVMTVSTNTSQKSPTIPNIILTDADSAKSDLSKDLTDFSNSFDNLLNSDELLDDSDFLLNSPDLSVDPTLCDDTFRMER
ncbi:unnamed protein product [Didymodactylos carnosus]|uniref:Transducer of regulated CREB activity N-terminal domain-containing protein n=1 Tax=Didymodactylos carnosus TaxID=1234261 RepID=A0A814A6L7_9BILA|nr:unnamed protein product [Didymodactylos carnosus]CAF0908348.1 unnamed protein product [Didymodactylos carnosus]CAF3559516.1 unnamed protein product [Didymodactylos carnosus]CAF3689874.1 unnamed protein product [Didymodactylos carnosus]